MNVLDLYRQTGCEIKRVASTKGGEYAGPCPGCDGRDRFRVWPQENGGEGSYWCRQCGKGGDGIQFLRDFRGMSYQDACKELDQPIREMERYTAPRPFNKRSKDFKPADITRTEGLNVSLWQKKAGVFVSWTHDQLLKNTEQMVWLADRGIDEDTVNKFRLGWNPGENGKTAIFRPRESWGLPTVLKYGKKKKLWIPRGLVIPNLNTDNDWVIRIRIRRPGGDLREGRVRYYIVPGSHMAPMITGQVTQAFIIVESELDAIMLNRWAGDLSGAVALGSVSTRPDKIIDVLLKNSATVLIALDFDAAGKKEAWDWWKNHYQQAKRWPVPEGKDPGEAYQVGVDIRTWVSAGLPPAFHVGPLPTDQNKRKRGELPNRKKIVNQGKKGLPATLRELYELLQKHPVAIRATAERTTILYSPGWSNWDVSRRISELVYFDPAVSEYLHNHLDTVIDKNNFILKF